MPDGPHDRRTRRRAVGMTPISEGVTPMNTLPDSTIQIRHAGKLGGARPGAGRPVKPSERPPVTPEELAAYHERCAAYEAGTRDRLRLSRQATAAADVCGQCGRRLAKDEPVWRAVVGHGLWSSHRKQTLRCLDCAPSEASRRASGHGSRPCDTCRRVVWLGSGLRRWRRHTFCSARCQARWYSRQRSLRAQPEREKACVSCGRPFIASRRDARTCSHACRQKTLRQRQADRRKPRGRRRDPDEEAGASGTAPEASDGSATALRGGISRDAEPDGSRQPKRSWWRWRTGSKLPGAAD